MIKSHHISVVLSVFVEQCGSGENQHKTLSSAALVIRTFSPIFWAQSYKTLSAYLSAQISKLLELGA
jgi:hypothetical protein